MRPWVALRGHELLTGTPRMGSRATLCGPQLPNVAYISVRSHLRALRPIGEQGDAEWPAQAQCGLHRRHSHRRAHTYTSLLITFRGATKWGPPPVPGRVYPP